MQIRDIEGKTGLERATIRFYEKEGLIVPQRKDNGYREYTEENLDNLLKIKLLRQLGLPLETIKNIRQGSTDFNQALLEQIQNLENLMDVAARAKDVCIELYRANISYNTLNATYYLQQLDKRLTKSTQINFREPIQRPFHPIRRFLARIMDYSILITLLQLLVVVVLRIRPYSDFLSSLITYGTPFLFVPIASFSIHKWGTTPGKWLLGLSVRSEDGCNLSFSEAKEREWQVLRSGFGFGLPIWSLSCLWKSYKEYQEYDMDWDRFCEYQYRNWNRKNKIALVLSIAVIITASIMTAFDSVKPKYRGDITVSEFSTNYNFYNRLVNDQTVGEKMLNDGTISNNAAIIDPSDVPTNSSYNFEFICEGQSVCCIRYENKWSNINSIYPIPKRCKIAALTAVMSQEGMGRADLLEIAKMLDSADYMHDGNIVYKNVTVSWDIEAKNCLLLGDLYTVDDETKPSEIIVSFETQIHN